MYLQSGVFLSGFVLAVYTVPLICKVLPSWCVLVLGGLSSTFSLCVGVLFYTLSGFKSTGDFFRTHKSVRTCVRSGRPFLNIYTTLDL